MRKMFVRMACLAAIAATVQLAGCGGKKTDEGTGGKGGDAKPGARLIGVWTGQMPVPEGVKPPPGMDLSLTVEFKGDGSMTMKGGGAPGMANGKWKVLSDEGDKVTFESALEPPAEVAEAAKKAGEKIDAHKEELLATFETADRIVVTPTDKEKKGKEPPITLERKK